MKKLVTIVCIILLVLGNSVRIANIQKIAVPLDMDISYRPIALVSGVYTTIYPDTPQGKIWLK